MKAKILKYNTIFEKGVAYVIESCPYRQGGSYGIFGVGSCKCEQKCPHCIERNTSNNTVKCGFRVLDLSLTYNWYDEIESGRKCVEYRALSDYWKGRLMACRKDCQYPNHCTHCYKFVPEKFDAVRFHRGQGGKQTMMYECVRITIGKGHVILGAPVDKYVFIIYLGKRLQ